ncbi:hypothetical protein OF83DRAFT_118261 [Amylostereum chailletii]|nr:hypothetical protein OF83DRAFT_118261 [Amylostereum chailletii]
MDKAVIGCSGLAASESDRAPREPRTTPTRPLTDPSQSAVIPGPRAGAIPPRFERERRAGCSDHQRRASAQCTERVESVRTFRGGRWTRCDIGSARSDLHKVTTTYLESEGFDPWVTVGTGRTGRGCTAPRHRQKSTCQGQGERLHPAPGVLDQALLVGGPALGIAVGRSFQEQRKGRIQPLSIGGGRGGAVPPFGFGTGAVAVSLPPSLPRFAIERRVRVLIATCGLAARGTNAWTDTVRPRFVPVNATLMNNISTALNDAYFIALRSRRSCLVRAPRPLSPACVRK